MPRPRSSAAVEREKASSACLEAEYGPDGANATVPATETMLTTSERPAASSPGARSDGLQLVPSSRNESRAPRAREDIGRALPVDRDLLPVNEEAHPPHALRRARDNHQGGGPRYAFVLGRGDPRERRP